MGKYNVKEIKASNGFTNTFKDQQVDLTYKDNTTELVYGTVSGTNTEVTGSAKLEKQDIEQGTQSQGSATFKGAEYTLYHASTNQPVT